MTNPKKPNKNNNNKNSKKYKNNNYFKGKKIVTLKQKQKQYSVEKIMDHKYYDGVLYFLVKWTGYDYNHWKEEENEVSAAEMTLKNGELVYEYLNSVENLSGLRGYTKKDTPGNILKNQPENITDLYHDGNQVTLNVEWFQEYESYYKPKNSLVLFEIMNKHYPTLLRNFLQLKCQEMNIALDEIINQYNEQQQ